MPEALGEVTAARIGYKIYVIGESGKRSKHHGKTLIYDIIQNKWTFGAKRPYPGNHHPGIVYKGKWYLFGGLGVEAGVPSAVQTKVQVFTPGKGWAVAPGNIPFRTGSGNVFRRGPWAHVCGGIDEIRDVTVNNCARYNLITKKWDTKIPNMPRGVNHATFAVTGNQFIVLGGRTGGNRVDYPKPWMQTYNFKTNKWYGSFQRGRNGAPPIPRAGNGRGLAYAGRLYLFGGETKAPGANIAQGKTVSRTFTRVEYYMPGSRKYMRVENMPVGLHGIYPIRVGNVVFIFGGGTKAGNSQSTTSFAYRLYSPLTWNFDSKVNRRTWYDAFKEGFL